MTDTEYHVQVRGRSYWCPGADGQLHPVVTSDLQTAQRIAAKHGGIVVVLEEET